MIPKGLLQQVRRIEITTSRLVTDVFAGEYHSVFKGQGIEFDEVREYQYGDDIRTIDWNVTARTGKAYIKKFVEERELTVMIMVDVSRSQHFGSNHGSKNQMAAEIASLLALSAIRNNDRVGLIIFTERIEKFIPPRKGRQHVLRVIREILYFKPEGHATDIIHALKYLNRVASRRTISFLISDFFDPALKTPESPLFNLFLKKLTVTNKRHDLIAISVNDVLERELPNCGLLALHDAETNEDVLIDTADAQVRRKYQVQNQERFRIREKLFKSMGIDYINIYTDESYADAFVRFFMKRKKLKR